MMLLKKFCICIMCGVQKQYLESACTNSSEYIRTQPTIQHIYRGWHCQTEINKQQFQFNGCLRFINTVGHHDPACPENTFFNNNSLHVCCRPWFFVLWSFAFLFIIRCFLFVSFGLYFLIYLFIYLNSCFMFSNFINGYLLKLVLILRLASYPASLSEHVPQLL